MSSEYLIVSQKILPAFYDKVVQAKRCCWKIADPRDCQAGRN